MRSSIKLIIDRISILNIELQKSEKTLEETELLMDYEIALSDISNFTIEIAELKEDLELIQKKVSNSFDISK